MLLACFLSALLTIGVGGVAVLTIPQVQNSLFKRLIDKINAQTHFTLQHEHLSLQWTKGIVLTGLEIRDPQNHLLCSFKKANLRLNPLHLLWKKQIVIDYLEVEEGQFNLVKAVDQSDFNLQIFMAGLLDAPPPSMLIPMQVESVIIHKLVVKNCSFLLDDQQKDPITTGFDPFHIQVAGLTATCNDVFYQPDKLTGTLQNFSAHYATQHLPIKQLNMDFKVTPVSVALQNLNLHTEQSHLQGDVQVGYDEVANWADAQEKINLMAHISHFTVSAQDLAHFIPYFQGHPTYYHLTGKIIGPLNDLYLKDFYLEFGEKKSYLAGSGMIKGLPQLAKTYFNIDINKAYLQTPDLLPHVAPAYQAALQKITYCKAKSKIAGTLKQFVTKSDLMTDLGQITTHLTVSLDALSQHSTYKGTLSTEGLHLGQLLDIDHLGQVSMHAQIDGEGLTPTTAQLGVQMDISSLEWGNYHYTDIRSVGRLAYAFFQGDVALKDPNCTAQFTTKIDLRNPQKEFVLKGLVQKIALHTLGFTTQPMLLHTDVDIKLQGVSWDDWTTDTFLKNTCLEANHKQTKMNSLHLNNTKKEDGHLLTLNTDYLQLTAEGTIRYSVLLHDLKQFLKVYQQRLWGDLTYRPSYTKQPYQFRYQLKVEDINPLLDLVMPTLYITPHTILEGSFTQADQVKLEMHVPKVDTLAWAGHQFYDSQADLTALQDRDGKLIKATGLLAIAEQQFNKYLDIKKFNLAMAWHNDEITFQNTMGETTSDWQLNVAGKTILQNGTIIVNFDHTLPILRLFNQQWQLPCSNAISFSKSCIDFENLCLSNQDQQISLAGKWSTKNPENLLLSFQNVMLQSFPYFLNRKIQGAMQGSLAFTKIAGEIGLSSDVHINHITINDLLVGDFLAKTSWQNHVRKIDILAKLEYQDQTIIQLAGFYDVMHKAKNIDLVATFSNAQLTLLTPFVSDVFKHLKGQLDGLFYIKGPLATPQLTGQGQLQDLTLQFAYLHAFYQGYGTINCLDNKIQLSNLRLVDSQAGWADFKGTIDHAYLRDFSLNLLGKIHNLEILDTYYEDNPIFYGKGIISGTISLTGPIDNVMINANAVTQPGTRLSIETRKYTEKAEQETYIQFVDFKQQKKVNTSPTTVKLQGLTLHLNLNVTVDAWVEIIVNKKDGDNIQSKGKGFLTIKSDTEGNINMTGTYELIEGTYTFCAYEIMKKKFKILPGSTITWIDQPYDGILHIKAVYDQQVSLKPLLTAIQESQPEKAKDAVRPREREIKKYPISILLILEGVLSVPSLEFDIQFRELPNDPILHEAVTAFRDKIAVDKTYLQHQVFSLFALKTFSATEGVTLGKQTLQRNVGEVVSQQISNLASKLDKNLGVDIDLDLEELSQETASTLPVKISYTLLGDRLVIARRGEINFDSDKAVELGKLAGDWSVEYALNKDNNFKLKVQLYPSSDSSVLPKSIFSAISFVYIKDFNRWRDLLTAKQTTTQ